MSISKSVKNQMRITQFFKTPSGIMPKLNKSTKAGTEKGTENTLDNINRPIYIDKTGKICLNIFAKPGSKENAIAEIGSDGIHVKIAAPPVDGEANKELVRFFSKMLNMKNSDIYIDKGFKNRNKTLILTNCPFDIEKLTELFENESEK